MVGARQEDLRIDQQIIEHFLVSKRKATIKTELRGQHPSKGTDKPLRRRNLRKPSMTIYCPVEFL